MSHATYLIGDVFERMAELPDNSVDLVLTSPPFLALRSYLPEDHPNKAKEIGSEPDPAEFIDTLLALSAEWRRILAPHGSIAVELGDTFASGGTGIRPVKASPDTASHRNMGDGFVSLGGGEGWPLPKSLALVPEAYRFALAYGHNPHTGTESPAGQWRIRNVIRWVRPNPPVGALGDKFRPATSEMVIATIASDRFFDLDAVREPYSEKTNARVAQGVDQRVDLPSRQRDGNWSTLPERNNEGAGAPPLDWWKITPKGYAGAHYAVWPAELCIKPIKAMCPERVCQECGEPSRRIVKQENATDERQALADHMREQREAKGITRADFVPHFPHYKNGESVMAQVSNWELAKNVPSATDWPILVDLLDLSDDFAYLIEGTRQWTESLVEYEANGEKIDRKERRTDYGRGGDPETWGDSRAKAARVAPDQFTDCGHNNWRPGIVLDPFAGTGTTLAVATGHGRDAIGIDIDERNALLAEKRIGPMFLTIRQSGQRYDGAP